jgi:hypothetical protein
MIFRQ